MKVKPKGAMHYRFGQEGKCTLNLTPHQVWDATEKRNAGIVILDRDNIEIAIPYGDFKKYFKEMEYAKHPSIIK